MFTRFGDRVRALNNRAVIFPSFCRHEVTPITMITPGVQNGRFCMTQFIGMANQP